MESPALLQLGAFLENNDVNITAACIDVNFASGSMNATIYASPCFWTFLFQDDLDRKILPVNTVNTEMYGANTCIRIAYKAFQLETHGVKFDFANIDFTEGSIAVSGKEKFDQMKDWMSNPFCEYQCNKENTHFVIAKKHAKVTCVTEGCARAANKNCGNHMCKKCCIKMQTESNKKSACTLKDHRLPKLVVAEAVANEQKE